jgi:hypothetical protein
MAFIYDLADTWNNAGTTFTAIKMNVTDTASNAASLLMDLQVGGSSRFNIGKSGQITVVDGSNTVPTIRGTDTDSGIYFSGNNIRFSMDGTNAYTFEGGGNTNIRSTGTVRWSSTGDPVGSIDLVLARDAANTLAQRNSTNAQVFRVYNTFTDASNYERGYVRYASNVLQIGHEGAGTGNNGRTIQFQTSGFNPLALDATSATFNVNLICSTSFQEFSERGTAPTAPATNSVRIYAEDNGAGKTRLMARFATGAAQQIAIEP